MQEFNKYEKMGAYHWQWYAANHTGYKDLVDLALEILPQQGTILDVGCGDGLTSFKLFEKGLSVVGIDTNEYAIRLARKRTSKKIYGTLYSKYIVHKILPFLDVTLNRQIKRFVKGELTFHSQSIYDVHKKDHFDYVLCHDVIEHVEFPEKLLAKIHECMKSFAIISTPNGAYKKPKQYDFQLWTPEEFQELLKEYSFTFTHLDRSKMFVKLMK